MLHQPLLVIESMKMEHVIASEHTGVIEQHRTSRSARPCTRGDLLVAMTEGEPVAAAVAPEKAEVDVDGIRPDLAEIVERHALGEDAQRPDAVERRRRTRSANDP